MPEATGEEDRLRIVLSHEDFLLAQQAIAEGQGWVDIAKALGFDAERMRKWINRTKAKYIEFQPEEEWEETRTILC